MESATAFFRVQRPLLAVMAALALEGIQVTLVADGGWAVILGEGPAAAQGFKPDDLVSAGDWLHDHACIHFPESTYARAAAKALAGPVMLDHKKLVNQWARFQSYPEGVRPVATCHVVTNAARKDLQLLLLADADLETPLLAGAVRCFLAAAEQLNSVVQQRAARSGPRLWMPGEDGPAAGPVPFRKS